MATLVMPSTQIITYSLSDTAALLSNGFEYTIPPQTLEKIYALSAAFGARPMARSSLVKGALATEGAAREPAARAPPVNSSWGKQKRPKGNRGMEVSNEDWESVRTEFHTTQIERKTGIDGQIDNLRENLNKFTKETKSRLMPKIHETIGCIIAGEPTKEEMLKVGGAIFDIASNNLIYSKLFAELYTELLNAYPILTDAFKANFKYFAEEMFNKIVYVCPDEDYDGFCKNQKANARRRATSAFIVNLAHTKVVKRKSVISILRNLLEFIDKYLDYDEVEGGGDELAHIDRPMEVIDEITENVAILFDRFVLEQDREGWIVARVTELSQIPAHRHLNLSRRASFKFGEMVSGLGKA